MASISGVSRARHLAVLAVALASCQAAPQAGSAGAAAQQPGAPIRVTLKLYSGSSTGLVVGESAAGGDPGALLPGQAFAQNTGLAKTFIWGFATGSTMLDSACAVITRTQAINIANSPGANAATFTEQADAGGQAAIKVQILPAHTSASNC